MTGTRADAWQVLADAAWRVTDEEGLAPIRCVLMTRLLIELAARFEPLAGARPKPLGLAVVAGNAAFTEHLNSAARSGGSPAGLPDGAWSVGIDPREPGRPGRFNGHLVVLDGDLLIDGSAPQLARPARGIEVDRPMVAPLPERWPDVPLVLQNDDGAMLMYTAQPTSGWQHAPDWRRPPADLVRKVLAEVWAVAP